MTTASSLISVNKIFLAKINASKIFMFYLMFLFILPNDIFQYTSLYTFSTPTEIMYKWNEFYVSWLYFPIIIYAIYCLIKYNRGKMEIAFSIWMICIIVKDLFVYLFGNKYMHTTKSYEYYFELIVVFSMIKVIYVNSKNSYEFIQWFLIFGLVNIVAMLGGVVLGKSDVSGEYAFRFTAPNLNQNTSGYLYLVCFMLLVISSYKDKVLLSLVFLLGVLLTGSRMAMLFCGLFIILYLLVRMNYFLGIISKHGLIAILLFLGAVVAVVLFNSSFVIGNTRFKDMIDGILDKGLINYIRTDKTSGISRIKGFKLGLDLIKKEPILGYGTSCYSVQNQWQIYKGPSAFPHYEWICLWLIFGIVVLKIYFDYIKMMINMMVRKNVFSIFMIIILFRMLVDGGLYQNSKNFFIIFMVYAICVYRYRENKYGCFNNNC